MNRKIIISALLVVTIVVISLSVIYVLKNKQPINSANTENTEKENSIENLFIDNSAKIAKLYKLPDNKISNKEYVKEISENEIEKIKNIIQTNEKIIAMVDFINGPDYIVQVNDKETNYGFRISNEHILVIVNYDDVYIVNKENDVKYLLNILNATLKDTMEYIKLDINKLTSPPDLYVNIANIKLVNGGYNWHNLSANPQLDFSKLQAVKIFSGPTISTVNNLSSIMPTMLPETAKVNYTIYKGDTVILEKEADRMVHGSYHMDLPTVLIQGDYIYKVTLTFTDLPNINATYYFKLSL